MAAKPNPAKTGGNSQTYRKLLAKGLSPKQASALAKQADKKSGK